MTEASSKLSSWQLRLFELYFDAIHSVDIKHQAANALLHLRNAGSDTVKLEEEIPVMAIFDDG